VIIFAGQTEVAKGAILANIRNWTAASVKNSIPAKSCHRNLLATIVFNLRFINHSLNYIFLQME